MAFDDARAELQQRRESAEKARREAAAARERHERLVARRAAMDRSFDPRDQEHVNARQELDAAIAKANETLQAKRADLADAAGLELAAIQAFGKVADPRETIGRLHSA